MTYLDASVIVEVEQRERPAKGDKALVRRIVHMAVRPDVAFRLDGIEEPLTRLLMRTVQVQVFSASRKHASFGDQGINHRSGNVGIVHLGAPHASFIRSSTSWRSASRQKWAAA